MTIDDDHEFKIIRELKEKAKVVWSDFTLFENFTGTAAPKVVKFAGINENDRVLDVGCGTGVLALTAARLGAKVVGADLTPTLVERAIENSRIFGLEVDFVESDVEQLPFENASFDCVISQFGHMFAPRPSVALSEMLRVLKPKGTIAFATWPPELFMGRFLKINGQYGPPLPKSAESPVLWGDVKIVTQRISPYVENLVFDRNRIRLQGMSVGHIRGIFETGPGPLKNLINKISNEPEKLENLRVEINKSISDYFEDNHLRLDYLLTRGQKI